MSAPDPSQSRPSAPPVIRWEDGGARQDLRPNACNVTSNRDEIALLFGSCPPYAPGQTEIAIRLDQRITLSPVAAKLLGRLIGDVVADYENRFGPIEPNGIPAAAPAPPARVAPAPQPPAAETLHEKQAFLLALVNALRVEYGYERSFKMYRGTLLANRSLLGINKSLLTPDLLKRVEGICERLGMPAALLAQFRQNLPEATFVHLGFEENERNCIYKVYTEFSDRLVHALQERPQPGPIHLHTGFKWDVANSADAALAHYTCYPGLTLEQMGERLGVVYADPSADGALAQAKSLIAFAAHRVPLGKLLYLEVTEEPNPRLSFDVNVYAAGLKVGDLYPLLVESCRRYEIPLGEFHQVFESVRDRTFGHVSGGIDRNGRDFLTVYFGVEGRGPR